MEDITLYPTWSWLISVFNQGRAQPAWTGKGGKQKKQTFSLIMLSNCLAFKMILRASQQHFCFNQEFNNINGLLYNNFTFYRKSFFGIS